MSERNCNTGKNKNIVVAFRGMHVSPAKHSYAWLPRKCDYRTDRQTDRQTYRRTDRQTPDKVIPMCMPLCFAGDTKMIYSNNRLSINEWCEFEGIRTCTMLNWNETFLFYVTVQDVSVIFDKLWQHIDAQADWRRRWTYDRVGFLLCPSRHRHGATLFPLILKKRTPLSSNGIHQMIKLSLKKYMWMPPLLWVEFQSQVHRCATGIMLVLCSEGRLFELRCPRAISGSTFDGKEVKRRIRASGPV